jgi:glutathione S-transferase
MGADLPELVLYDFPATPRFPGWASFSPFVLEVQRALVFAQLPFERRRIGIGEIKKLNPLGQLPVLGVGGENVADSTRILLRIEALAPGSLTRGLSSDAAGEAWLWEEFADTALYPHVLATRWVDERGWAVIQPAFFGKLPPVLGNAVAFLVRRKVQGRLVSGDFTRAGLEACADRLCRVLDQLDARAPDHGFWLGPHVSVADIGLFAQLHSLRLPSTVWSADELGRRPRLTQWLDRVDAATSVPTATTD